LLLDRFGSFHPVFLAAINSSSSGIYIAWDVEFVCNPLHFLSTSALRHSRAAGAHVLGQFHIGVDVARLRPFPHAGSRLKVSPRFSGVQPLMASQKSASGNSISGAFEKACRGID